jgi:hypothetical protein
MFLYCSDVWYDVRNDFLQKIYFFKSLWKVNITIFFTLSNHWNVYQVGIKWIGNQPKWNAKTSEGNSHILQFKYADV